jgi:glycosyltransferase involved in cell wall biosynthesis
VSDTQVPVGTQVPVVYLYPRSTWRGNTGRQQFITEALSHEVPVVVLETPGPLRRLLDIRRPRAQQAAPNILVVRDALALRGNRWWRRLGSFAARVDAAQLHRELRRHGVREYVLWLSAPQPQLLTGLRVDRLVYDCIDPCFNPERQEEFDRAEYAVAAEAEIVFCTAQILLDRMAQVHADAHLLNNAASPELYAEEQATGDVRPEPLRGRPGPVVGYLGTIDWRIDCETLTTAAKALPDYTFCIAGRVNADQEHRVAELRSLPNVVMPGAVPTEEGAAYNNAFDVGVIPFLPGYVGDGINPVKMYMYLLAGNPVVSTWLNECRLAEPHVTATRTPAEFVEALRKAVSEPDEHAREARVAFALANTWGHRAHEAVALLRERGLLRSQTRP